MRRLTRMGDDHTATTGSAGEGSAPALPMYAAYLPMMKSAVMTSAAELGVFHHLHATPGTARAAANALATSLAGMERVLFALESFGLLRRDAEGRYHNSRFVEGHFTPAAAVDFTPGLLWNAEAARLLLGLSDVVRRGGPEASLWSLMARRPGMGALFSSYMEAIARHFSPDIVDALPMPPGPCRVLDIGGSHGLHAAALLARHPEAHATVFDLEVSLARTRAVIAEHGLQGRMRLLAGDARTDALRRDEDGYDVALLLSVLHNQTEADAPDLLRRAAQALKPGGLLVVHEYFHDPRNPAQDTSAFLLTLLVEVGTGLHTPENLRAWLRDAGCDDVRRVDLAPGKGSLLLATRI